MSTHALRLLVTMSLFWVLLSGYFKTNLIVLGIISVAIVVFFSIRMEVHKHKTQPLFFPFLSLLGYWGWLFIEIFKSNMDVAKLIINPKMPIKPLLKIVYANQNSEIGRVVYSNSITLTPGTVAMNVSLDRGIIVHALHEDSIAELERGEMHDHVMQLEEQLFIATDSKMNETRSSHSADTEKKPSSKTNDNLDS
jgi:multicomponent Na+:H+ antiporter subunit E